MVFCFLGATEVAIILVIALLVFGPQKLPEVGKQIGSVWREMNRMRHDVERMLEIDDLTNRYDRTPYYTPNDTIYPQISGPLQDHEGANTNVATQFENDPDDVGGKLHDDIYLAEGASAEGIHHDAESGVVFETAPDTIIPENSHSVSLAHTEISSETSPPMIEHGAGDSGNSIASDPGVKEHKNNV